MHVSGMSYTKTLYKTLLEKLKRINILLRRSRRKSDDTIKNDLSCLFQVIIY
jgi:hypothetical protein